MVRRTITRVVLATILACSAVVAQEPSEADIWDLSIGSRAEALPQDAFLEFACGSNGGPPSLPLESFSQFDLCRAEDSGAFEVAFRYNDEKEYTARALQQARLVERHAGTRVYDYPVIASALFNADGVLAGIRLVTDPRDPEFAPRHAFWALGNILMARYGEDEWQCTDLEPRSGQTPVGQLYIDRTCSKQIGALTVTVQQSYYHRRGQSYTDPQTGTVRPTSFESTTRFELVDSRLLPPEDSADFQG